MKTLNNILFAIATPLLVSNALAGPPQGDCADITSLSTMALGSAYMDGGEEQFSDDYLFSFASGPWESAPLGDTGSLGIMWYEDGNGDNMAFSWADADAIVTNQGFELSVFSYALGRYTGSPGHYFGKGKAVAAAEGLIEVTEPMILTLEMDVYTVAYNFVNIQWERALERVEWQDHGDLGSGYFVVETLAYDQYQNFVESSNDYSEYSTGQTSDRILTIELDPGIYRVSTRTDLFALAADYGIVGTVDHFVRSTCDVQLECIQSSSSDMNNDYKVDGEDMTIMLGAWGTSSQQADLDGSGIVDGADLTILLGDWD